MEGLSPAPLNLGKSLRQRDSAAGNGKAPVFFLNMLHEGHMIRTVHASLMVVKQQHNRTQHAGQRKYPWAPRIPQLSARPLKLYESYGEQDQREYFMLKILGIIP